jgi:hypothetical protein
MRVCLNDFNDSQKNRKDLAWFARRATSWILEKTKERKIVRGQRSDEVYDPTRQVRAINMGKSLSPPYVLTLTMVTSRKTSRSGRTTCSSRTVPNSFTGEYPDSCFFAVQTRTCAPSASSEVRVTLLSPLRAGQFFANPATLIRDTDRASDAS